MENLFSRLGLNISRLRGQGYDGASNMQGELNGLKTLILREIPRAYYVHCFAHQLQLTLIAVTKNHGQIALLFTLVTNVVNVVGVSCKRRDIVKNKQATKVVEALNMEELSSGQGLNQETNLKRASDTHWSSHYGTLVSLAGMFSTVIDVLEMISDDGSNLEQLVEANVLLDSIQSFEFVFNLHLMMRTILAITNELSQALQRKDKYIVNAMNLVQVSKRRLQMMRESGWTSLLDDVSSFCEKHEIDVPQMDDMFITQERRRLEFMVLNDQLNTCIIDILSSSEFSWLNGIANLAKKMIEIRRDKVYPLVYLLLILALILPVATATVERIFSAMNIVKNQLRNRIGDEWMNDSLVVYIERGIFDGVDNGTIMENFQKMKTCRGQL
ncbi:zinc finger MYM-type protein 1-like [Camellia sinensis]|uniref:zinc finger MYM-type protein 1-like n=1 Tax=Camellia sinensis TaxID=4442 RepID=UPI001036597D|nr:zinc finger MYM-type protein 1-like [Camellia sinensis]